MDWVTRYIRSDDDTHCDVTHLETLALGSKARGKGRCGWVFACVGRGGVNGVQLTNFISPHFCYTEKGSESVGHVDVTSQCVSSSDLI